MHDSALLSLCMLSQAQPCRIDVRLAGEHALRELHRGHLQGEDSGARVLANGSVAREVQPERAFPHAGPRGDDYQI